MKTKLNIPSKLHIGYRNRDDTYTKKLAYVIYTDEKGKMRKATSWESWRDKTIEPTNIDNEPTSGFVLNKGVGGQRQSYGWNARNEYIRVYDPRDFEFEISVANLLFILTHCNCDKGKGLEGEFVYSWEGTELVLLPTCTEEYKKSKEFTGLKTGKVTKKQMVVGHTYTHKNTNQVVYIGRHKVRNSMLKNWSFENKDYSTRFCKLHELVQAPDTFKQCFWDITAQKFIFENGFTNLANVVSTDPHEDYASFHEELMKIEPIAPFEKLIFKRTSISKKEWDDYVFFLEEDSNNYQIVRIKDYLPNTWINGRRVAACLPEGQTDQDYHPIKKTLIPANVTPEDLTDKYLTRDNYDPALSASLEYLKGKKVYGIRVQYEGGATAKIYHYG